MRPLTICLIAALASGCVHGITPEKLPFAAAPAGAMISVRVTAERSARSGELLAADSAGILLRDARIVRIPWTRVRLVDVRSIESGFDIPPGSADVPARQRRLALVSRFPQGITEPVLAQLLAASKQERVEELP